MGNFLSSLSHSSTAGGSSKSSRIITFHSADEWRTHFDNRKNSIQLMVIDFSASWCGPCRFIEPAFIKIANKYMDVEFVKIDVDELREVAQEFQVEAMPTFMLIIQGKEVDKVVGADKDELEKKIKQHRGSATKR